jgi:hypothetical protein
VWPNVYVALLFLPTFLRTKSCWRSRQLHFSNCISPTKEGELRLGQVNFTVVDCELCRPCRSAVNPKHHFHVNADGTQSNVSVEGIDEHLFH